MVIAEPPALGIEGQDERVRVLEVQQDPLRARVAGEQVSQFPVDTIEQGGPQQQLLDVVRLALQHLGEQVLRDRPIAARELRDEALGVGVAGQ